MLGLNFICVLIFHNTPILYIEIVLPMYNVIEHMPLKNKMLYSGELNIAFCLISTERLFWANLLHEILLSINYSSGFLNYLAYQML